METDEWDFQPPISGLKGREIKCCPHISGLRGSLPLMVRHAGPDSLVAQGSRLQLCVQGTQAPSWSRRTPRAAERRSPRPQRPQPCNR